MIYPSADKLENWGSKYSLVVLAAKRAKQLKNGAPPLIDTDTRNPLTIALEEIAAGKIDCQVVENDIPTTLRDEPELAQLLALRKRELEEEPIPVVIADEDEEILLDDEFEDDEEEEEEVPVIYSTDDEDVEEEPEPDNVVDVDAELEKNLLDDEPKKKVVDEEDEVDIAIEIDDAEDYAEEDSEE